MRNKTHEDIVDALKEVFQGGRIPTELRTIKGKEWTNRWFKQNLRRRDAHHYVTKNVTHANKTHAQNIDVSILYAQLNVQIRRHSTRYREKL